jgi:JmjC domain, hydroxylase
MTYLKESVLGSRPGETSVLDISLQDRPETLMCYFGVGDTYTPAHKDLCASVGHNLLSTSVSSLISNHSFILLFIAYSENEGSAFWFLSSTSDADAASTWFHEMNEELDLETHLATVDEWAQAPFTVYICQQRLGDFVLVPKRSCHQVREWCTFNRTQELTRELCR